MAISEDLLELAVRKFDQHYDSATPVPRNDLPRKERVPGSGIWKSTSGYGGGSRHTLSVRRGHYLLSVVRVQSDKEGVMLSGHTDIWLDDTTKGSYEGFKIQISERPGNASGATTSPHGGEVAEYEIPMEIFVSVRNILQSI